MYRDGSWGVYWGPHVKLLVEPTNVATVRRALTATDGVLRVLESAPGPDAAVLDGGYPERSA